MTLGEQEKQQQPGDQKRKRINYRDNYKCKGDKKPLQNDSQLELTQVKPQHKPSPSNISLSFIFLSLEHLPFRKQTHLTRELTSISVRQGEAADYMLLGLGSIPRWHCAPCKATQHRNTVFLIGH